jgi:hypothetical protein
VGECRGKEGYKTEKKEIGSDDGEGAEVLYCGCEDVAASIFAGLLDDVDSAFFACGGAPDFGARFVSREGVACSLIKEPSSASVGTAVARASTTLMRKSGGPGADLRKLGEGR